jgi:hypothetical protein
LDSLDEEVNSNVTYFYTSNPVSVPYGLHEIPFPTAPTTTLTTSGSSSVTLGTTSTTADATSTMGDTTSQSDGRILTPIGVFVLAGIAFL